MVLSNKKFFFVNPKKLFYKKNKVKSCNFMYKLRKDIDSLKNDIIILNTDLHLSQFFSDCESVPIKNCKSS